MTMYPLSCICYILRSAFTISLYCLLQCLRCRHRIHQAVLAAPFTAFLRLNLSLFSSGDPN